MQAKVLQFKPKREIKSSPIFEQDDLTYGDRLARIKSGLEKINKCMAELKAMNKENK